jgi:hypothetical protein
MPPPDYNAALQEAQATTQAALIAMQSQQKETAMILAAISSADPHNRQMLAMILANPDLKQQVEAAVAVWLRAKTAPAPAA